MGKEAILRKTKHMLGVSEDSFEFLDRLKKKELNALYLQIAKSTTERQADLWQQLAKVNHYVPAFLSAKLAQNVFGEVVCANIAAYMNTDEAVKVMKHLSLDFMAKVAAHMIPEKTVDLVNAIPFSTVRKITKILLDKKDYFTVGRFVDTLELTKVVSIAKEDVKDNLILLQISSFVENKRVVAEIFMSFSDDRMEDQIKKAYQHDLIEEVMSTMKNMTEKEINHVSRIINRLPKDLQRRVQDDLEKARADGD